jgi:hypothetical protein
MTIKTTRIDERGFMVGAQPWLEEYEQVVLHVSRSCANTHISRGYQPTRTDTEWDFSSFMFFIWMAFCELGTGCFYWPILGRYSNPYTSPSVLFYIAGAALPTANTPVASHISRVFEQHGDSLLLPALIQFFGEEFPLEGLFLMHVRVPPLAFRLPMLTPLHRDFVDL